jgi:threonine/homoserine/homoserine lactone efflux protein
MNYFDFYLYVLSVIIMISTPGPVMILVASAGLKGGYTSALKTIIGTNLASLILISISILILKGAFSVNETLFIWIKILGCLYIAYLGFEILKEVFQTKDAQIQTLSPIDGGMKKGFLVGISNPKDIIFFSSFFPQFIGIHSNINTSLMILVIAWIILDFLTLSVVYLGFNKLSKTKYYSKILALCGWILILIAVYGIYSII